MIQLFILAMAMLLLPKVLGVLRGVRAIASCVRTVNPMRVLLGAVMETLLSALYAPIMMMMQSRQLLEILFGQDSGWATQTAQALADAVGDVVAPALAADACRVSSWRWRCWPCRRRCSLWMAPALVGPRARAAAVGGERQRRARQGAAGAWACS